MDKLILSELTNGLNTVWMLLAAGLCTGRSRFYKSKKYGQYPDEELR